MTVLDDAVRQRGELAELLLRIYTAARHESDGALFHAVRSHQDDPRFTEEALEAHAAEALRHSAGARLEETGLIGVKLVMACQRSDCTEEVILDIGEIQTGSPGAFAGTLASDLISGFTEIGSDDMTDEWRQIEGWGWDTLDDGVNRALHCPAHRAQAAKELPV